MTPQDVEIKQLNRTIRLKDTDIDNKNAMISTQADQILTLRGIIDDMRTTDALSCFWIKVTSVVLGIGLAIAIFKLTGSWA